MYVYTYVHVSGLPENPQLIPKTFSLYEYNGLQTRTLPGLSSQGRGYIAHASYTMYICGLPDTYLDPTYACNCATILYICTYAQVSKGITEKFIKWKQCT